MNLRPIPLTTDPSSGWQNVIQRVVQSHNVLAGSGLRAGMSTGDFTQLGIKTEVETDRLVWRGTYDPNAEYVLNDVVRVEANKDYIPSGSTTPLPIGATSVEGYPVIPISLGLFVCVNYVPPAWADPNYFFSSVVNFYNAGEIPWDVGNGIRWTAHNVYYPVYPEIPTTFTQSVDTGYGFSINANQTFWQAMPFGTMPLQICTNGLSRTFYVVGAESGSLFKTEYLPYSV